MSAVLLGTAEHDTPEWHELRAGGIGGSEIAAVLGLSRWTSPFALWHRKRGNLAPQPRSSAMDWGHRLEPLVRDWWQEQHPEFWVGLTGTWAHEDRPWQRVNPDGLLYLVTDRGTVDLGNITSLLEIKTSRFGEGFTKTDIPLDYMCQIQWSLDIFDLPAAHVAVLVGGNDPHEYLIEANAEDQATLRKAAEAFWNSIQADAEPPLDATDHTYRAVQELNPQMEKGEFVDLAPDLWADYLRAKSAVETAEGDLTLAKARILTAMRGVQYARFSGENVLRRQRSSAGTYYLKETA